MVSEKFSFEKLEILQRCVAHLHFRHPAISQFPLADISFNIYLLQRAEKCTNCSSLSALSAFEFSSYIRAGLLWVKSYANEENYKHWRQQRLAICSSSIWILETSRIFVLQGKAL